MIEIRNKKKVEASGDTVAEVIWELKRNRPDDLFYPRVKAEGSTEIVGVDVRTGEGHMTVIEMTVEVTE